MHNIVEGLIDFLDPESDNLPSMRLQPGRFSKIALFVLVSGSIDLDNEPSGQAGEVREVLSDRHLAAELVAANLPDRRAGTRHAAQLRSRGSSTLERDLFPERAREHHHASRQALESWLLSPSVYGRPHPAVRFAQRRPPRGRGGELLPAQVIHDRKGWGPVQ
jgi:hypothetical protein